LYGIVGREAVIQNLAYRHASLGEVIHTVERESVHIVIKVILHLLDDLLNIISELLVLNLVTHLLEVVETIFELRQLWVIANVHIDVLAH
jgi:hypothetical protein